MRETLSHGRFSFDTSRAAAAAAAFAQAARYVSYVSPPPCADAPQHRPSVCLSVRHYRPLAAKRPSVCAPVRQITPIEGACFWPRPRESSAARVSHSRPAAAERRTSRVPRGSFVRRPGAFCDCRIFNAATALTNLPTVSSRRRRRCHLRMGVFSRPKNASRFAGHLKPLCPCGGPGRTGRSKRAPRRRSRTCLVGVAAVRFR